MDHLKKALAQWENANEKYIKDTQQHAQRIGSVLRTFWALDFKKNALEVKQSILTLGRSLSENHSDSEISEKFIQKTERTLLENPYKLDKQLAALDQMVYEASQAPTENPAKRQRLQVIYKKTTGD